MEQFRGRLNQEPDVQADFLDPNSFIFVADKVTELDPGSGKGKLAWVRHRRKPRVAFGHMGMPLEKVESWEFPAVYDEPKDLPFRVSFAGPRTVRLQLTSRIGVWPGDESPMLAGKVPESGEWKAAEKDGTVVWTGPAGRVAAGREPWFIEIRDGSERVVLRTHTLQDGKCMIGGRPVPFSFARRAGDAAHRVAASFRLFPGERLFGCGEHFGRLDKRGQKVGLWTQDSHGTQTGEMYKPVPFYLSDRGYGVFVHGSTPMVFDFGCDYDEAQVLYTGEEALDLFVFLGTPGEILTAYTGLTGRSPRPPLWSFGLWMSRITYNSEAQAREIAASLRSHRVPCDVIHLDTGWFEHDWRCDYEFSKTRFKDPKRMISDLKADGFRICLWQLPYFTPPNRLHGEIVEKGLAVRSPGGGLPADDAVLDFSNPKTVAWYQEKLAGLLKLGVGAIKVDFGEAAPLDGLYASGRTGWHEHNLYPLRYNRAAADVTRNVNGTDLIWARSAWAGSQRYPLHWGGDAEATDGGMAGTLRGGLSFGLSGFSYWSHDAGGFFPATPKALYRRWYPFTLLSSHCRCHGLPPTEPWEFGPDFLEEFRRGTELRYRLIPYLWAQAAECSKRGHPMLRPLFFEFPGDPGSWTIEDEYLLGSDLLVAPLVEEGGERDVYLPPGEWVDVQEGKAVAGAGWTRLKAGPVPVILLARGGRAIPTVEPAAHTGAQDWGKVEVILAGKSDTYRGLFCGREDGEAQPLEVGSDSRVSRGPGGVAWAFRRIG